MCVLIRPLLHCLAAVLVLGMKKCRSLLRLDHESVLLVHRVNTLGKTLVQGRLGLGLS